MKTLLFTSLVLCALICRTQTVNYYAKPGTQYTLSVTKSAGSFYISEELNRISFDKDEWFNYLTASDHDTKHLPKSYITDSALIRKISTYDDAQSFSIVIAVLNHEYAHNKSKGAQCKHIYTEPLCKIISVK